MVDYSIKLEQCSPFAPVPLRTFITITGYSVTVPRIGTLALGGSSTLSFSLSIGTTASHVLHKSLAQVHATSMPGAIQAVSRFPLDLSWCLVSHQFWHHIFAFRHLISGSFSLISLNDTWHGLMPCLFLNAHHNGSLPMQLKVVWSLLLQARLRGAYPHLLCSLVAHSWSAKSKQLYIKC